LAILYVLILPGCVLLQPTEPFGPVPTTKATGITAPAPSQPFPAKEEAVPEALTLDGSLEIALKNNPEVAATLWDVSVAGAKVDQAKAARWPTLTYEGNHRDLQGHSIPGSTGCLSGQDF
jgi:outer membrane protein TolC